MGYAETYSAKSDVELQQLERKKDTLRPEAATALEMELRRRGVSSGARAPHGQEYRATRVDAAPYGSLIFALVCFTASTASFVLSIALEFEG